MIYQAEGTVHLVPSGDPADVSRHGNSGSVMEMRLQAPHDSGEVACQR